MVDPEQLKQLLGELRKIREKNKVSLEQISNDTRIRLSYLQSLENGDLDNLPHIYDLFIFKAYISKIGVKNPDEYIHRFNELRHTPKRTSTQISIKNLKNSQVAWKEIFTPQRLLALLYISIPLLIIMFIVILLLGHWESGEEPVDTSPIQEITAQEIIEHRKQVQKTIMASDTLKQDTVEVDIFLKASEPSWIQAIVDHTDTLDFILGAGNSRQIKADSVAEFVIGNPPGLLMQLNGKSLGTLAPRGQVVAYMKVTPRGIERIRRVVPRKRAASAPQDTTLQ